MERKILIKNIISTQHNEYDFDNLIDRDTVLPVDTKKIIVVTGVRRCGKTTLLKITRNRIIKSGIRIQNTLFFSFDDERLLLDTGELDLILQAYRELYPGNDIKSCYLFFDEIQNIENWDKFIRRVYDTITQNIFISGSNSKLLGSEISTSLRGRTIQYELFPLSFREYINFNHIKPDYYSDSNKAILINAFSNYLTQGGFPETIGKNRELQQRILNDYYSVLLFRDIIERYSINQIPTLKFFLKKLIVNIGKPFSVNKIFNDLKSQGIRLNKNLLYEILEYVEAVYLGMRLYKFDYSVVNREKSDKKIYFIDNGLLNAVSYNFSGNYGTLLENSFFIWLRNRYKDLYYFKQKKECDFIIFDRDKAMTAIQVSYTISEKETFDREINGLIEAMKYFNIESGLLVTAETEDRITISNKIINIVPAYKLMTENKVMF